MTIEHLSNYKGEAIFHENISYSFDDLSSQIAEYKEILENKIAVHDVVIIDSDYSFYSISLLFSMSYFSCIVIPIVKTTESEFDAKVKASSANLIISIDSTNQLSFHTITKEKSEYQGYTRITSQDNCGIVLFSSGTTGAPKVMVHNFSHLLQNFTPPRRQKTLKFLLFLMFDHIGGLNTLLSCLNNGSPIVIPEKRNPSDILLLIENSRVQVLPTSPTFLNLMLLSEDFHKRDLTSLKMITYGTERMPQVLLSRINKFLPNIKLLQTFGTSETGILKTQSKSSTSLYFKIADDKIQYKIENDELFLKSKNAVNEYKGLSSDKFTDDGWFATGDIVQLDDEGYMKIVGRISKIINVGGLKVSPTEVEEVINSVDGVVDASVFAKDNAITGQMVFARVVVIEDEDEIAIKKRIRHTCKEVLDKYKRPAKIEITKKLEATTRFKKLNSY
tara:strand:+ start:6191 stop:7531 length:1341 start_codon:yes stop_codon:yes gene_type:complete